MAFTFDSNNNLNVALVGSTPVVSENLASVGGANITLGAKTSANSLPVVLASDEANLPVVGASSGSQSATWTSANGAGTQIVVPCAGYATVTVNILSNGGTFNAGQLEFLAVNVNGTFSDITGMRQKLLTTQLYDASNLHTLATNERWNYAFNVSGFINFYIYILTPISGTGSVTVTATPVAVSSPGPTTVGQSDATKLNVTNIAATTTNSSTTWSSATPNFTFFTINCLGYNTVIFDVIPDAGSVSAGQFGVYGQMPGGVNGTTLNYMRQLNNFDQLYDSPRLTNFVGLVTARYIVNCAGYQTVSLFLTQPITGTLTVSLRGAASMAVTPGPTTVGQSDPTKLNATVTGSSPTMSTVLWNSGTANGTTLAVPCSGYGTIAVEIIPDGGTITGGVLAFFASVDGTNFNTIVGMREINGALQNYDAINSFVLSAGVRATYWFQVGGYTTFLIQLSPAITGTANITIATKQSVITAPGPTTVGQSDSSKHRVGAHGNTGSFKTYRNAPAAGNNATVTVPAGFKWLVKSIFAELTTSATVQNRIMFLNARDSNTQPLFQVGALSSPTASFNQTASTTVDYSMCAATNYYMTTSSVGNYAMPFPEIALGPGGTINTNVQNLAAGDAVAMNVAVMELPD